MPTPRTSLSFEEALSKLRSATPPQNERGLVWWEVAVALYDKLVEAGVVAPGSGAPYYGPEDDPGLGVTRTEQQKCPLSGKRCYSSAAVAIERTRGTGHTMRAYFCKECKTWHATKELYHP